MLFLAAYVLSLLAQTRHGASQRTDFFYFEGEDHKESVEVNFGLQGTCTHKGVQMFAQEGVVLVEVRADGQNLAPLAAKGYRHGAAVAVLDNPGPSFYYHMPLTDLESWTPYDPAQPILFQAIRFELRGKLPRKLEITYRIRCGDGSVSDPLMTRGRRFPLPRPIKGSE